MDVNGITSGKSANEELASTENALKQPIVQKRSRKRSITIFVVVSLLNVGLLTLLWTQLLTPAHQPTDNNTVNSATIGDYNSALLGKSAPDLTLAMNGSTQKVHISQFKGKSVILNFWASWCGPCNDEAPFLQKNVPQLQSRGVTFISINAAESPATVAAFSKKYNITYPSVEDTVTDSTSVDYGVTTFPMTVFINREGIIKAMWNVQLNDAGLKLELSKITS